MPCIILFFKTYKHEISQIKYNSIFICYYYYSKLRDRKVRRRQNSQLLLRIMQAVMYLNPGPSLNFNVTLTSIMPAAGIKVEVSTKEEANGNVVGSVNTTSTAVKCRC